METKNINGQTFVVMNELNYTIPQIKLKLENVTVLKENTDKLFEDFTDILAKAIKEQTKLDGKGK